MIRRALVVAVLVVPLLLAFAVSGSAASISVVRNATFPVTVRGFAPRAVVTLRLAGARSGRQQRADRGGVLRTSWRVPAVVGSYRLLVSGAPPGAAHPHGRQNLEVAVPRIAIIPFQVVVRAPPGHGGGHGVGGVSTGPGHGGGQGGGHRGGGGHGGAGTGGVSVTGFNTAALLFWGDLLLVAGLGLAALGRARRGRSGATSD